ncbi:hypothetical protein [Dyadobacter bucti]|uniref:hypothetical protein n=1 Tax=Dyadobacter bucti TaxID=2572203 RepID=UPI001107DE39|nr:hypothetical protein [Dyadobacter bucti]
MKEKIKVVLVNKYKSLGYSQKAINAVLDYLEKSVKEETEIEEAVDGVGPILKVFQSEIDARIAAAEKAKKDKEEEDKTAAEKAKSDGVESETAKKTTKKDSDEVPEWAKALIESQKAQAEENKKLSDKLTAIESGKTSESRKQILESKIKDAPEKIKAKILKDFGRISFEKDEDFDTYITETEADLAEISQSINDQGLGQSQRPYTPTGGAAGKEASKEEASALLKSILP